MVGDTPWDVKAAGKAEVGTIAVLTGGFAPEELKDAGAVAVFESVAELRDEARRHAAGLAAGSAPGIRQLSASRQAPPSTAVPAVHQAM